MRPANGAFPLMLLACLLACAFAALPGCGLVKRKAVGMVADTLASGGDVFTRDDDPELVGAALPFGLKLYESLLDSTPNNQELLVAALERGRPPEPEALSHLLHLAWRAGMSPVELGKLIRAWTAGGMRERAAAPAPRPHVLTAVASETGPALEQLSLFDQRRGD